MNSNESGVSANVQPVPVRPPIHLLSFKKGADPKDKRKEAWISDEGGKTWRMYVADPGGPVPATDGEAWICEEVSRTTVRRGIRDDITRIVVSLKYKIMDDMVSLRFGQDMHRRVEGKFPWAARLDVPAVRGGQLVIFHPNKRHVHLLSPDAPCWRCKFRHSPHKSDNADFFVIIVDLVEQDTDKNAAIAFERKRTHQVVHSQRKTKKFRGSCDEDLREEWNEFQTSKKPGRGVIRRP